MTKLIFVRHAQADSNQKAKVCFNGTLDEDLTVKGVIQAKKAAEKLKNITINHIFSSSLKRAVQTAEIINHYHNLNIIIDKRLNEANFGLWEGMTMSEVKSKYPEMYNNRLKDKYHYRIKHGESYEDVENRVSSFLNEIIKKYNNDTVLIVTHATVLKLIFKYLLKKTLTEVESHYYRNTCITIINVKDKISIEIFNDSSHLEEN